MREHRWRLPAMFLVATSALATLGCPKSVQRQLESAAKDWSAMVRASQIIPVYPLTEDIQPGDIFLVQLPIDRQQEIYRTKGYLPLDNHLARMNPAGYKEFYKQSFELGDDVPKGLLDRGGDRKKAWSGAPAAAFPTYSFAVKKDKGLNLAIPLQGVPVGLSLMQSSEAVGSVSIRNARTIGVDIFSLHDQLANVWWPDNRQRLAAYAPTRADGASQDRQRNYLRVITRVYLTGEVDISLRDMTALAGGADVAVPRPTDLLLSPAARTGAASITVDDYDKNLDTLNKALVAGAGGAPGGSVRVTSASTRTIGLKETLVPPLTIGYLGFDCEILEGGVLGPAIPTHALLSKLAPAPSGPADQLVGTEQRYADAMDTAGARADQGQAAFRAAAVRLGPDWVRLYDRRLGGGSDYADAFGDLALVYWTREDRSTDFVRQATVAEALERALSGAAPHP